MEDQRKDRKDDKKETSKQQFQEDQSHSDYIPNDNQRFDDAGDDRVANSNLKGAGQQQRSSANPMRD